ncbi:hypothetical protein HG531_003011 [Fusarium graminearum]|nr:hypothetical protein HG531_003011 [Fusarium graminearum]
MSHDGQSSVEFTSSMQELKLDSQASSRYYWRVRYINDSFFSNPWYNVGQILRKDRLMLIVQERVRIHADAVWFDGIRCPFGHENSQREWQDVIETAGKLKEDDGKCHRQSCHTTHGGTGCNKTVHARLDAGTVSTESAISPDTPVRYTHQRNKKLGPILGGLDEESTQRATNDAHEYEAHKLEVFPVDQVPHFEHDNLVSGKKYETSSKPNSTPPKGAPKATATPAAAAAEMTSRRLPSFRSYFENIRHKILPTQAAM